MTTTPPLPTPPPTHYHLDETLRRMAAAEEKPGFHIRRNGFLVKVETASIQADSPRSIGSFSSFGRVPSSFLAPPDITLSIDGETIEMDPNSVVTASDGVMHMTSKAGERFEISQWSFPA